jgi:hypothetical protein
MRMKKLLVLSAFMLAGYTVHAQVNAVEAKAAYLLAEENYGKGAFTAALDYINEATTKLGTANAKISYLKVMILKEMSLKDTNALVKMDTAILAFEKAPDIAGFNEEKILEITKIKLERKRNAVVENEQRKFSAAALEENMTAFQNKLGWRIGMPVDSVVSLHKAIFDDYFKKNRRSDKKITPDAVLWLSTPAPGIGRIDFKNGFLAAYQYYFHNIFETPSYAISRPVLKRVLDDMTNQFGYLPEPKVSSSAGTSSEGQAVISQYTWKSKRAVLLLEIQETTTKASGWAVYKMTLTENTGQ